MLQPLCAPMHSCQQHSPAAAQVGPTWSGSDTEQFAKFQVYLTAPASENFTTPYTLTIAGRAPFTSVSPWNWEGAITADGQVGGCVVRACMREAMHPTAPEGADHVCAQVTGPVESVWEALFSPSTGFTNLGGIFSGPAGQVFPQYVSVNGQRCGLVGSTYYGS